MTEYALRSGAEVLEALDKASRGVHAGAEELSRLSQSFHEAKVDENGEIVMGTGLQFDTALREEVASIYKQAIENQKKPPPQDVREAMAYQAVQTNRPELWAEYHHTKARIDALKSWISNMKATISANQSIRKGEAA